MAKNRFYYVIKLQFLGFRYSGWQKQPHQKTVEGMLSKTLKFVLPGRRFKILGAGRTDAKVSALEAAFELFLDDCPIEDFDSFLVLFNKNLPQDIKAIHIQEVDASFNIIKNPKRKEYVYLFSYGEKNHPFSAPFITNVLEELDLQLMMSATKLFQGNHDFSAYTVKGQDQSKTLRCIDFCEIRENNILKANFFPEKSYALHVIGKGFIRYQIRMMMGALIQLGKGQLHYDDIVESLTENNNVQLTYVAPGSGLLLNRLELD
ncbi:MAG: tRNA pseudouridine(38-40) synthase TruA [Maribacter sp.]|nr:tRNA pseudouridine(38-40) synthase TruA [Maribacter sp.]